MSTHRRRCDHCDAMAARGTALQSFDGVSTRPVAAAPAWELEIRAQLERASSRCERVSFSGLEMRKVLELVSQLRDERRGVVETVFVCLSCAPSGMLSSVVEAFEFAERAAAERGR